VADNVAYELKRSSLSGSQQMNSDLELGLNTLKDTEDRVEKMKRASHISIMFLQPDMVDSYFNKEANTAVANEHSILADLVRWKSRKCESLFGSGESSQSARKWFSDMAPLQFQQDFISLAEALANENRFDIVKTAMNLSQWDPNQIQDQQYKQLVEQAMMQAAKMTQVK
jgi:hypothetical protein